MLIRDAGQRIFTFVLMQHDPRLLFQQATMMSQNKGVESQQSHHSHL